MDDESRIELNKLQGKVLIFVAAFLLLAMYGATTYMNNATNGEWSDPGGKFAAHYLEKLKTLERQPPDSVRFIREDTPDLVEKQDVAGFLALLQSGKDVTRHHSHPDKEMRFAFSGEKTIFMMGRDSTTPDEFWLEVVPDEESPPTSTSPVVRQFQSKELSAWLAAHSL